MHPCMHLFLHIGLFRPFSPLTHFPPQFLQPITSPLLSSSPVTTPGDYDVSAEAVGDAYMQKTASDLNDSQVSDIVL